MSAIDRFLPRGQIVSLRAARERRKSETILRIEEYWSGLRRGRLVPTRGDLDPRGLEGALSNAFILERVAGGIARFRISGAHMTEVLGMDVRGMPLSALFEPGSRAELARAIAETFDGPSVIRMQVSSPGGFGKGSLSGQIVLMPLRSDMGDITRILGAVQIDGRPGRGPRRLVIDSIACDGLTGRGEPLERPGGRAVASAPPLSTSAPRKPAGCHLQLVVNNA